MIDESLSLSAFSVLVIGFILGIRHATDADHLAAVSTMISQPRSIFAASLIGGLWGMGHTLSLLIVGTAVIFLKLEISEAAGARLESLVGVMLILLGASVLWKILRGTRIHAHRHEHSGRLHAHLHFHDPVEQTPPHHHKLGVRSVLVGMVHGLAGSAGLMLLVIPAIGSKVLAVAYILVFGVGSIAGMVLMSFFIGLPMHFTRSHGPLANQLLRVGSAILSVLLGGWIIFEKLIIT